MAITNHERVGKALELLKGGLGPFVEREFKSKFGDGWAFEVRDVLSDTRLGTGKGDSLNDSAALLVVMDRKWNDVFRLILGKTERSLVNELLAVRNRWAHQQTFSGDDAYRALDSAGRLLTAVSAPQAAVEWQSLRLSGQDALAVRASRKLKNDELLVTALAGTRLRMELDRVPLWRGDHVAIKQLAEDFARYLYLPRLSDPSVLVAAAQDGLGLLLWNHESFAYADGFDEAAGRYRGLRGGQHISVTDGGPGLLVHPDVARRQIEAETAPQLPVGGDIGTTPLPGPGPTLPVPPPPSPAEPARLKRYHGTVMLGPARAGRDASRIAEEVITHLVGLVGSSVRVTLEIEAEIPNGVPENVVRIVTENGRTLKFLSQGFEVE